jgi:PAS domain-containing protein
MTVELDTRIAALHQGEHLCSVYESTDEMLAQAVPYIRCGLLNGEQCIYVADEHSVETVSSALMQGGINVDHAVARGQLKFWTRHDYRQPGDFQLEIMRRFVERTLDEGLERGHAGIRLTVEMTWTIDNGVAREDLVRWEDFINTISYPGSKISFLCQYNARLLSRTLVGMAVYVHPVVLVGRKVCPNLRYQPAEKVLSNDACNEQGLEWLLERLQADADHAHEWQEDSGMLSALVRNGLPGVEANPGKSGAPIAQVYGIVEKLLASLPIGVYMCEAPTGIIKYYNRWAEDLWGRRPVLGDSASRFCGSVKLFRPNGTELPHAASPMAEVIRKGIVIHDEDIVIERPDGSRRSAVVNIMPIRDQEGQLIGAINLALDITERKRAEAARVELVESLEQSKTELQEKLQDLEKFEELVVGRELRMIELKKENERLKRRLEALGQSA